VSVRFARESMAAVREEILPLLHAHWAEVAHYADMPLNPNWPWYEASEAAGQLRIFTARDGETLIGYAIYVIGPGLHYRDFTYANQDILFVLPEYRRGFTGRELLRFTEQALRADGVHLVLQHVKVAHDFGPLLRREGYEPIDTIWGKRL
jgi:GNAT superfamily N-acetyltransferase